MNEAAANADRRDYVSFLATAAGIVTVLALLGALPTRSLGGAAAVTAMLAGCAVSLIGSVLGMVPILLTRERSMPQAMPAVLASMFVRMGAVVALGVAAASTGLVEPRALVLWLVIAHAVLLVADTRFTLKLLHLPEKR